MQILKKQVKGGSPPAVKQAVTMKRNFRQFITKLELPQILTFFNLVPSFLFRILVKQLVDCRVGWRAGRPQIRTNTRKHLSVVDVPLLPRLSVSVNAPSLRRFQSVEKTTINTDRIGTTFGANLSQTWVSLL